MIVQLFRDHEAAGRFTNGALKILFFLIGCKVTVNGKEYMETPGAKIYAANHTSYFDVLALMLGLGVPYRFVAKMEVASMPFIGTFMRQMGHLSFDRDGCGVAAAPGGGDGGFFAERRVGVCFSGRDVYAGAGRAAISAGGV